MHQKNRIPPGITRPRLDPGFVDEVRRRRYTDALAELCVEQGYAATTVTDVVSRAGTARNTFYDLYENRAETFNELIERGSEEFLRPFDTGSVPAESSGRSLEARLRDCLGWVAENGSVASALLLEAPCGGERTQTAHLVLISDLAVGLRRAAGQGSDGARNRDLLLAGSVVGLVRAKLVALRFEDAPQLVRPLVRLLEFEYGPLPSTEGRQGSG